MILPMLIPTLLATKNEELPLVTLQKKEKNSTNFTIDGTLGPNC